MNDLGFSRQDDVVGLKTVLANLGSIPDGLPRSAMRTSLRKAAKPVKDGIQIRAPRAKKHKTRVRGKQVKKPLFRGILIKSLKMGKRGKNAPVIVIVGPRSENYYGIFFEYGSKKHQKAPFVRPAWQANKDSSLRIFSHEIKLRINKHIKKMETKGKRK